MSRSGKSYQKEINQSIKSDFLQKSLSQFTLNYPKSREKAFYNISVEDSIQAISDAKNESIQKLSELYKDFKEKAKQRGVIVHYAKDADEANQIILDISTANNVKKVIKSKSMTSEEIYLNHFLENKGLSVTETDLGEWIIQLRKEGPSHMVMPAIHLSKGQVAHLFSDHTGKTQPEDVEKLVKVAREKLRMEYFDADMGITGANFAVASTGAIGLVTNEGNARLVNTLPKVVVHLIGVEKLVPDTGDALDIIKVLPKNATGQVISSYISWINGSHSTDQQQERHIVFLDNGRINLSKDPVFSDTLKCIRCGACANVCPVYGMVGGHVMGHTYIGPIGLLLTTFFHGEENARSIIYNCINCKACEDICASKIPLPDLIKEAQIRISKKFGKKTDNQLAGRFLKNRKLFHTFLKMASKAQRPITGGSDFQRHLPNVLFLKDQSFKALPAIAKRSLRELWTDHYQDIKEPKLKIALFPGCLHEFVYPEQILSILPLLQKNKIQVDFPENLSCCGLPLSMLGDKKNATELARQNVQALSGEEYDYIVTLCASCGSFIKESYPSLAKEYLPDSGESFSRISKKMIDFPSFLNKVLKYKADVEHPVQAKVSYHAPCHLHRGMKAGDETQQIIQDKAMYTPLETEKLCCGFGGTYSMKFPEISAGLMEKKLDEAQIKGTEYLVSDCPGCIMQLRGGVEKRKLNIKVLHTSEFISKFDQ